MSTEETREDETLSSSSSDSDNTFDDWVEDPTPCKSLFEDVELKSVEETIKHDREKYGFDLNVVSQKLNLDFHQRVRLINYIRTNNISSEAALKYTSQDSFLSDDTYLQPAIPDDPLLLEVSDDWSDDEVTATPPSKSKQSTTATLTSQSSSNELDKLKAELEAANSRLAQLQSRVHDFLEVDSPKESTAENDETPRDDDTHYFDSYGYQEIHAIMLRDTVRTMSYAKFILSNPAVFKDKLVMDVGCGTGILSMFAARAGAKHVFAVDASSVANKARQNIKDNGLEDVITVIQGKVESISLPSPYDSPTTKIDVIISEWMGYALLYESMLDSVLVARDRFLRPPTNERGLGTGGGVMAPSQCKMVMSLGETTELWKEHISFWDDVYGFKMSSMTEEAFSDALIEHLPPSSIVSDLVTIKDLPIQRIKSKQLTFSQSFQLIASKDCTIHAFLLYFDTYFEPSGADVASDATPKLWETEGNFVQGEIMQVGRDRTKSNPNREEKERNKAPVPVSFSTGPQSLCTHWKQTAFLLKTPFKAIEGTVVKGEFHLKKSDTNSRELDVEIHYAVSHIGLGSFSGTTVQMYKVR